MLDFLGLYKAPHPAVHGQQKVKVMLMTVSLRDVG